MATETENSLAHLIERQMKRIDRLVCKQAVLIFALHEVASRGDAVSRKIALKAIAKAEESR